MITNVAIALGVMMIPIGFLMMTNEEISRLWILFVGVVGFGCLLWAAIRANKEDKKKDDDREYRNKLLESIASKMGVDVDKIHNKKKGK